MGDRTGKALLTPEQQLRAVQVKAQHARDLPSCGSWCVAGMVATFTAGVGVVAATILWTAYLIVPSLTVH
jgi:hypothetical protein